MQFRADPVVTSLPVRTAHRRPQRPIGGKFVVRALLLLPLFALVLGCNGPLYAACDEPPGGPLAANGTCPGGTPTGQRIADFRQSDHAQRPRLGIPVNFHNVDIIGVDDYVGLDGKVGDIFVQQRIADANFPGCAADPVHGGRVCGLQLFSPSTVPAGTHMSLGDIANVSGGTYEEFNCGTCSTQFSGGRTLPEIGMASVERTGSGLAAQPIDVTMGQLTDPDHGDDYVGVLVRITDVATTSAPNTRGEIQIGTGLFMTAQLTALNDPATGQGIPAGSHVTNIVGIASYFFGSKIIPRNVNDYTVMH